MIAKVFLDPCPICPNPEKRCKGHAQSTRILFGVVTIILQADSQSAS